MVKKMLSSAIVALFVFVAVSVLPSTAYAATTVNTEEALRAALANGEDVALGGDIILTQQIAVGHGGPVTIDGAGFTIRAGNPAVAPGSDQDQYNMFHVLNSSSVIFKNVTLDANNVRRAIWLESGTTGTLDAATVMNGTTIGTRNFVGGAIYVADATLNITNGSVLKNNSTVWSQVTYDIRVAEEISKNPAFANLSDSEKSAKISQVPNGGAIYGTGASARITITDSTIKDNETKDHSAGGTGVRGHDGNGGAIYLDNSSQLVIERTSFLDNHVARVSTGGYQGGAIFAGENTVVDIKDSTVNVGTPFNTGGFLRAYAAQVTVDNTDFTFVGRADSYGISGGAFASQGSSLKINNSRFTASPSSKVTFAGGFVDIVEGGYFELTNSTMTGRGDGNGKGLATYGGAIAFETGSTATALIQNSTIENVHADVNGGAISISTRIGEESKVNLRVVDSTITRAGTLVWNPSPQVGGAIFVGPGNTLSLEGTTITTGRSGRGGLIYNEGSTTITNGTAPSNLSGGFVYAAVGAGIFNDGYLKLDEMTLGGNSKGDWSTGGNHPSSIKVGDVTIPEYPGLNVYANKDVIVTPKAKLDAGDVRVIDGQSAVLLTGTLTNQLNVSVSENIKTVAATYAGANESVQRYIGHTVAKGADGYTPVESDAQTIHYVTRDTRQASSTFNDHVGLGAWDYVLSDENTVVLGQRAKMWYHPNDGHFGNKAVNVEEEQPYTIYSSTKQVNGHPAARPGQMTPYEGTDPVRDGERTITDALSRTAVLNSYRFVGWYCKSFTPEAIENGQANTKGYDFTQAFTDGQKADSETDEKPHVNPCTSAARTFNGVTSRSLMQPRAATESGALITDIVVPHELTAYAGYTPAYGVTYEFVSGTPGKTLPSGVTDQTPAIDTKSGAGYFDGDTVTPTASTFTAVPDGDGEWTFQSWDSNSKVINQADQKFIGTWVWTQKLFKVTHEFQAAAGTSKSLPEEISDRTPEDNLGEDGKGIANGTKVMPTDTFDKSRYSDTPGEVWSFTNWDKTTATIENADVHFIGYWTLTETPKPAKDPTYSEWIDGEEKCEDRTVTQTRTKTTYSYEWNTNTLEWVETTSESTETQERAMTAEETEACAPPVEPEPDTPEPGTPTDPDQPQSGTPADPDVSQPGKPGGDASKQSLHSYAKLAKTGPNLGVLTLFMTLLALVGTPLALRRSFNGD